jgi:hypothetical protein
MPLIGDLRRWPTNARDSKQHDNQVAMNSMRAFFTRFCPSPISRRPALLLVSLAWSGLAFCGVNRLAHSIVRAFAFEQGARL